MSKHKSRLRRSPGTRNTIGGDCWGELVRGRRATEPETRVRAFRHAGIPNGQRASGSDVVRCRRSAVAGSSTFGYDRVGCSVFLNNRYQDPTVGVFISVDPLVAITGEP